MPNGYIDYTGDQATVLPSNTEALLHFSNQFAEMERQRQAERLAQQKLEQQRKAQINSDLAAMYKNPDFKTNSDYQSIIDNGLSGISQQAYKELSSGLPEEVVRQHILDGQLNVRGNAQKVNEIDKNIAAMTTHMTKQFPGVDPAALAMYAKKAAHFKQVDGKDVLKDFSELNPDDNYVADAYNNHFDKVFPADVQNSATGRLFDAQKLQDESEEPTYDAHHNLVTPGFKGKLSPLVTIQRDANGKVIYKNGKPVLDVAGSSNYRMPDQETDYVDENGNKVPVVSDDTFRQYYTGALGSGIEKQVKEQLNTLNSAGYQISPDSPYADMLRKNILYQNLKGEADRRYKFSTPQDKSAQLKHQAFSEAMQRANLSNSNARLGIAQTLLKMKKEKEAKGDAADYVPDFLGDVNDTYGVDAKVQDNPGKPAVSHWFKPNEPAIPPTYKTVRIIPITADPKDINIIAGKPDASGNRPINPKEFILEDGTKIKGWQYDPATGNAIGDDGVEINKESVQREFLNHIKKGVLNDLNPEQQPTSPLKKAADKVKKITGKFKGTDKKMF